MDDGSSGGGLPPPQLMHPRAMGGMGGGGMGPNGMGPGLQGMAMYPQSVDSLHLTSWVMVFVVGAGNCRVWRY